MIITVFISVTEDYNWADLDHIWFSGKPCELPKALSVERIFPHHCPSRCPREGV